MGPCASLRLLLRRLCQSTPWEYAIFWKVSHQGCMMLTWEEGYCENSKWSSLLGKTQNDKLYDDGLPTCEMDLYSFQAPCPIGPAVSRLSSHVYSLGHGILGTVAITGRHKWLFFTELDSSLLRQYPDEWQLQFAAGIKTILLVPVGSIGVVQLGSFELVAENVLFVADVEDLFSSFHNTSGGSLGFASNDDYLRTYANEQLSLNEDYIGFEIGQGSEEEQPPIFYNLPMPCVTKQSTFPQADPVQVLGRDMVLPYRNSPEVDDFSPTSPIHESLYQDECFGNNDSIIIECKSSSMKSEDLFFTFSQCNNDNPTLIMGSSAFSNSSNSEEKYEQHYSNCSADGMCEPFLAEVLENADNEMNGAVTDIWNDTFVSTPHAYGECLPYSTLEDYWSSHTNLNPTIPEFDKDLINETDIQRLVESLAAEMCNVSDGGSPNELTLTTLAFTRESPGNLPTFHQLQSKCRSDASTTDHLGSESHLNQGLFSGSDIAFANSPSESSSSMNDSTLINEEKPHQMELETEKNKPKKSVLTGKKRPIPDDNKHRPRPRDRQLIQDRVKELRNLVPSGKKCSIDALLDRTIKHMVFLRSVSSQADKLRRCSRSKVLGVDHEPMDFEDENYGVTWAYELDTQPEACPIVVKDLDQQGHMLVEMLCIEYGDFLEIAQVMRRLRLTILKGVMESRSEKLWAHFVVEATKGFNRMEILWPLMQLLQQNRIPLTSRF